MVYLAQDSVLGGQVALKLLVPPPAAAALARERMRREVQAVRGLTHANIVAVHDFVDDGSWSFVVMEYVAGPNLSAKVRQSGPLGATEAVMLGQELLDVLTALGRTQGRIAQAGAAGERGGDGIAVLAAELEASLSANAEARREVEEYLLEV